MDIYLAVYPSFVLAKLNISRVNKVALGVALGIGSLYVPMDNKLGEVVMVAGGMEGRGRRGVVVDRLSISRRR